MRPHRCAERARRSVGAGRDRPTPYGRRGPRPRPTSRRRESGAGGVGGARARQDGVVAGRTEGEHAGVTGDLAADDDGGAVGEAHPDDAQARGRGSMQRTGTCRLDEWSQAVSSSSASRGRRARRRRRRSARPSVGDVEWIERLGECRGPPSPPVGHGRRLPLRRSRAPRASTPLIRASVSDARARSQSPAHHRPVQAGSGQRAARPPQEPWAWSHRRSSPSVDRAGGDALERGERTARCRGDPDVDHRRCGVLDERRRALCRPAG